MARLALLALTILLVSQCRAEGFFEDGQEYQYSYLAYTMTGVREPEASGSSFGIKGNVLVQKKAGVAVVKISDVTLGMHNGPEFLLRDVEFVKKPELAVLEKPFKISYLNGKISSFDADASDVEWSINIKKGLATTLQVDHSTGDEFGKGDNLFMRTVENTVTGSCNTTYSFGAAERGRIALIKQRTLSECTDVPRVSRNTFGATNCAGKLQDELLATTQAYYQLSRQPSGSLKPHMIASLGYQVLQWHPPAGSSFYNLANTTMILKSSGPIAKPISATNLNKHYSSLRYASKRPIPSPEDIDLAREEDYFHPEEPKPQESLRTKAVEILNKMVGIIGSSPVDEKVLSDPTVTAAISLFSYLNLDSLKTVFSSVEGEKELRNFFIELLPLCGSNPAALFLKEMILEGKLADIEARRAVAFFPYYLRLPSEKLLTSYEELLRENPKVQTKALKAALALSFGHLIGITCKNKARPCQPDTITKYSRIAFEAFKNAQTHPEQMVTLLALRNTKLAPGIERLIPYTKSGVVSHALRPHVIYALQPLGYSNRDKFLAAVMPIVLNMTETTEVRIAAVATIFNAQPSFLELQQLIAGALWERNVEVRNFIITTFRNYADSKNPCMKPIANKLELLLRRVAHIQTSHFRSSNRVFDYQDQKYGFGGGLQLVTVYGEESRAPVILAGRINYRVADWGYAPAEIFIRLEGVEDAFVRMFRKLDPKDFKLDALKDLLQKTMKIAPRTQEPLKMEIILRSQGYNILYRHVAQEEIMGMLSGKGLGEMIARGLKMTRNLIMLGGQHTSWRSNDLGLPVGVGLSNPGLAKLSLAYGDVNQPNKLGRSLQTELDLTLQVQTYLVAYNPLGVSQGVVKVRGSRAHIPFNGLISLSPAEKELELKVNTPTEEEPFSFTFTSKTMAFMWGREDERAIAYLKESCPACKSATLVSRGEKFRKGEIIRDKENNNIGLESHAEIYNCESYHGKGSISKVLYESFKPSEINSHGSYPGFILMGLMQFRNYFYYYPPTTTCSIKSFIHKTKEHPANAIELKLKLDSAPPSGKKATPGKFFGSAKGSVTFLGDVDRKYNVDVNVESEPFNVKSHFALKIARQGAASLDIKPRALCLNVKTAWAALPDDVLETPSAIEPSVYRDISFVWGEAPLNECPKANAKEVSTLQVKVTGNITDAQRTAASARNTYPYDRCDIDKTASGRSGVVLPMTEACFAAVMEYATPRSYVYDIRYENISPRGMKAMHRMDTIIKAGLAPYWDMHAPHGATAGPKKSHNSGHIEMKLEFNEEDVDIHVHTDLMHSHYENVDMLKNLQKGLRNARVQMSQLTAYETGLIGVCNVAPESIVTFDNVTLNYELPTCYTLVSADCSPQPRYAVFAKKSSKNLPLAVKIYAGGHTLEFNPTGSDVEIKANDKVVKVDSSKPYTLADKENVIQYFVVNKVGARYFIKVPMLKLTFRYTGDDITNMIPATHRSSHCGMCGDFNGQFSRELVGPSGCNLKDASDLAKSYVLRDKNCKDSIPVPPCAPEPINIGGKNAAGIVEFLGQFSNMDN